MRVGISWYVLSVEAVYRNCISYSLAFRKCCACSVTLSCFICQHASHIVDCQPHVLWISCATPQLLLAVSEPQLMPVLLVPTFCSSKARHQMVIQTTALLRVCQSSPQLHVLAAELAFAAKLRRASEAVMAHQLHTKEPSGVWAARILRQQERPLQLQWHL